MAEKVTSCVSELEVLRLTELSLTVKEEIVGPKLSVLVILIIIEVVDTLPLKSVTVHITLSVDEP